MFVFAPPLHQDPASGQCARDKGRVQRGVVGAVVPVASRAVDVGYVDVFDRHVKRAGEDSAQWLYALAGGEDLQTAVVEFGPCGRRGQRSVHDERSRIGRLLTRAEFRFQRRIVIVDGKFVSDQVFIQRSVGSDLSFPPPDRALSHPGCKDSRGKFVGMRDRDETAVHHEFRGLCKARIETLQPVIQRRRPHHARV